MSDCGERVTEIDEHERAAERAVYEPPRIERLGTLAELTQSSDSGTDDGLLGQNGGGSSI